MWLNFHSWIFSSIKVWNKGRRPTCNKPNSFNCKFVLVLIITNTSFFAQFILTPTQFLKVFKFIDHFYIKNISFQIRNNEEKSLYGKELICGKLQSMEYNQYGWKLNRKIPLNLCPSKNLWADNVFELEVDSIRWKRSKVFDKDNC